MVLPVCAVILAMSWLLGKGALFILYGKQKDRDFSLGDSLVMGYIGCIGLAEAAHLGVLFFGRSFSACANYFSQAILGVSGLSAFVCLIAFIVYQIHNPGKKKRKCPDKRTILLGAAFLILVAMQVLLLLMDSRVYRIGDMTLETVKSFLATDRVYQINPLTGASYEQGIPSRLQILCLPSFYGFLVRIFGVGEEALIWHGIPIVVLLVCYGAYAAMAKGLFAGEPTKQLMFLCVVAILIFSTTGMHGVDGFNLLYGGFRGETLRNAVLLPYTISLVLRKKWRLLPFVLLAEVCVVWTLYGLGLCFLTAAVFIAVSLVLAGKEAVK